MEHGPSEDEEKALSPLPRADKDDSTKGFGAVGAMMADTAWVYPGFPQGGCTEIRGLPPTGPSHLSSNFGADQ